MDLRDLATQKAQERGLPDYFVKNLIKQESNWNTEAVSPAGARGVMQIMPMTAHGLGTDPSQLFDPVTNIDTGTRLLAQLNQKYGGDLHKVAAAYNAGPGRVPVNQPISSFFSRLPAETRDYVQKVVGPPPA